MTYRTTKSTRNSTCSISDKIKTSGFHLWKCNFLYETFPTYSRIRILIGHFGPVKSTGPLSQSPLGIPSVNMAGAKKAASKGNGGKKKTSTWKEARKCECKKAGVKWLPVVLD